MPVGRGDREPDAALVISAARAAGLTIATAESLTGGLVSGALTAVPGASEAFVGGVVAYDVGVKVGMLGVGEDLLKAKGPVSEEVALAMAEGVRVALGADVAVATTGVAGPDVHGGRPPGTVCIAAVGEGRRVSRTLTIRGDREAVRREAVAGAIVALVTILHPDGTGGTTVE
ncbi:MAG: CinA family protein [Demequinaceae bacterium]|nr:CinA family protein [Demequinaceae bacterium]